MLIKDISQFEKKRSYVNVATFSATTTGLYVDVPKMKNRRHYVKYFYLLVRLHSCRNKPFIQRNNILVCIDVVVYINIPSIVKAFLVRSSSTASSVSGMCIFRPWLV